MLHGAGLIPYIWVIFGVHVDKSSSTMEHVDFVNDQYN